MSYLCNLVRMARPVRDAFGGRLLLLRRKTARLYGAGQRTIRRKSTKINSSQLQSTPGQRKSKRKASLTSNAKARKNVTLQAKSVTPSRVRTVKARNPPTEVLGRPRKRRGLQGRGFSACVGAKTILVELSLNLVESWQLLWATASSVGRQGTTARWGRPPCPSAAARWARKFVCSPQTAIKPPRKPHNPRMAAGGTATRGRAKSRVLRVLCASCASYGALAAGDEVEEAAHEKFARSPCHEKAASAPIAPASVRGAMGVYGALAYFLQRIIFPLVRKTNLPAFPASFSPLEGV